MSKTNLLQRGMTSQFAARYLLVEVSEVAELTRQKHQLSPKIACLAAESIAASALMAAQIKGEERLTIQIQSEKPKFSFFCDLASDGGVRARLSPRHFRIADDLSFQGVILSIKHNAQRELYRGLTPIDGQRVDKALEVHLQQSTQVDVAIKICISQSLDTGEILKAVGLLIERLPAAPDLPYLTSEEFAEKYGVLFHLPASELFQSLENNQVLGETLHDMETRKLFWKCHCSRQQIVSMLYSLGPIELQAILQEVGYAEVNCDLCNTKYLLEEPELLELIAEHGKNQPEN